MKDIVKKIKTGLERTPLLTNLFGLITIYRWNHIWKNTPGAHPPAIIKQKAVIALAKKHNIRRLVETGTYMGDMINATKKIFRKIDSIELSREFYENAVKRFKDTSSIKIWNGDSALILPEIVNTLNESTLFWLDAHYSGGKTARSTLGDTPIGAELDIIFNKWIQGSIVLIDDARLFIGKDNYPTIDELTKIINTKSPLCDVRVNDDMILITEK